MAVSLFNLGERGVVEQQRAGIGLKGQLIEVVGDPCCPKQCQYSCQLFLIGHRHMRPPFAPCGFLAKPRIGGYRCSWSCLGRDA